MAEKTQTEKRAGDRPLPAPGAWDPAEGSLLEPLLSPESIDGEAWPAIAARGRRYADEG